uniref:Uncharacterized protein n=1 Tax=Hyaloperonospora arabidopsidis (strain Emoy2) TaxID=559515 RepID=M4BNN0_HYAAE
MFSQQLCILRILLVKQGYLLPLDVKFILNELGDGGVLAVWPQGGQQCAKASCPIVELKRSTASHSILLKWE